MLIKGLWTKRVSKWVLNGMMIIVNWLFEYWNHCLIWTRSARMEETSMNEIKSIKQYSILISIELSEMNNVDRHFEDLEYLDQINFQYFKILSNVTERGL